MPIRNIVFMMTDTQNKSMIGAYGNPRVDTPNLDRLAAEGVRFERAYTTCPLCTPARSGIFTGLYPQVNGAYCNNLAPHGQVAMAGTIFREYGRRAAYTGKWHLDGSAYFGDGVPGGGFEGEWWYDGKRYAEDIGPRMFETYRRAKTADELRRAGFELQTIWGHRVADRALDFLEKVGDEPFFLAVSFDEPHGPCVAPPEYWEQFTGREIEMRPNFFASAEGKPELLAVQRRQNLDARGGQAPSWEEFAGSAAVRRWFGCNSYVDREIGRVVDAVDRLHPEETLVVYTTDHGDQFGSHGLVSKGPMMYEESCNIPLIARVPGGPRGEVSSALVSQIDLLPTLLDYAGIERPEVLNGCSMRGLFEDPHARGRDSALLSFTRFAINHDSYGEFYPVRCLTDGRYKLIVNLFETDELYDLEGDPYELCNRIDDPALTGERNRLHDRLLEEMDRVRDPFRTYRWSARTWRTARHPFYHGGATRGRPRGFSFQPAGLNL